MPQRLVLILHLVSFASFLGAAFAQTQFLKASARSGLAPAIRDEYERLCAFINKSIEIPALYGLWATGLLMAMMSPEFLHAHWLHAKMTLAFLLVGLAHVEKKNARRVVEARAAKGDAAAIEIAGLGAKHGVFALIGTAMVLCVLVLVVLKPF
jgi:uncharacterized membrane protein